MEGHGQPEGQWGSVSMLLAALDNPAGAAGEALRPRPLLGHPAPAPNFSSQTPGKDGGLSKGLGVEQGSAGGEGGGGGGDGGVGGGGVDTPGWPVE